MTESTKDLGALRSTLADKPELLPMLVRFAEMLPKYAAELDSLRSSPPQLREATHQLKGALGIHGYPLLVAHAENLELAIQSDDHERIAERIEMLNRLMMRVANST